MFGSNPVRSKDLNCGSSESNQVNCFADDPVWESTERGLSTIGELGSGWTVFRILIPKEQIKYRKSGIDKMGKETEAQIGIYPAEVAAGITIVMVSAKERPGSSTHPAVRCLVEVHQHLSDRSDCPFSKTTLLVPAAQASSLVVDDRIKNIAEESRCHIAIYLTDIVSIFSPGDVIIEVIGEHEHVDKAIALIASDLRGFKVDEGMMFDLKVQGGIPTPYNVVYAIEDSAGIDEYKSSNLDIQISCATFEEATKYFGRGAKSEVFEIVNRNGFNTPDNVVSEIVGDARKYTRYEDLKTQRKTELSHFTTIPLSMASHIMGLNGENISTIQQSCLASIILTPAPASRDGMTIEIKGGNGYEVELAKTVMEGYIGFSALDHMLAGVSVICPPFTMNK